MGKIWKCKMSRIWTITSSILCTFLLIVAILATQVELFFGTLNIVFGGYRYSATGDTSKYQYYKSDYNSKEVSLEAANKLNEEIVEEGIILLKNQNNALPLNTGNKISVFGKNSVNLVYGGSGSGGHSADSVANLYNSLTDAGFTVNPTLKSFYNDNSKSGSGRPKSPDMGSILSGFPIGETEISHYTSDIRSSYSQYNDAALVVISRIGGEGYDLPRTMKMTSDNKYTGSEAWSSEVKIPGARNVDDHYLQLDQNETDMIKEACNNFSKVVVIINCSTSMELGFLDDEAHYAYNEKIKAAIWIGNTGGSGAKAIGKILNGSVNPSGRTVDLYARNFKNDPTWNNFSNNLQWDGNRYYIENSAQDSYFVRYEEGIYIGYRYYETRGLTDSEQWYTDNVVYPFGYGMSYTNFNWEILSSSPSNGELTKDGTISITVRVKNTGTVAGKDVVQLYYTAPYTANGIEKSHVVLSNFAKTKLLKPNEHEDIILSLKVSELSSYDYADKNENFFKGYEVEQGTYQLKIMRNSHLVVGSVNFEVAENYFYDKDTTTNTEIKNLFDNASSHITEYLSRNDWTNTWPQNPVQTGYNSIDVVESAAFFAPFKSPSVPLSASYDRNKPWYTDTMPTYATKSTKSTVKLYELIGKDYDDAKWDKLLDQMTIEEMATLIGVGAFKTQAISNIDKPETKDFDGPAGFVVGSFMSVTKSNGTCFFASECVIGATWNIELARKMGEAVGNEGIWGVEESKGIIRTFSGWYAPAVNIHRSQFGGRNFEYYSEEGLLSGKLAAEVCAGAKEKGVYTYLKHFAVNDQETNRSDNGLATWLNEQAMREIYFKPFEIAVKEGGTNAMMSSFNRIGSEWTGASYNLLTQLLRNEWGFVGMVITDYNGPKYMDLNQMIRAGGDLNLFQSGSPSINTSALTATQVSSMRKATKNILYTVANSNSMNGRGDGVEWKQIMPIWLEYMLYIDAVIVIALGTWGYFSIKKALK